MHQITKAVRIQVDKTDEMEHSTPLYLTSSFCFDTAEEMRAAFADENNDNIYSRFSNPNVQEFTDKICALEGAESGYATASGMSAVFGFGGNILTRHLNVRAFQPVGDGLNRRKRWRNDDFAMISVGDHRFQRQSSIDRFANQLKHLPVSSNDRFSHNNWWFVAGGW